MVLSIVFVAQARNWVPEQFGGIFWFGVDDAASTVFTPMYSSITKVPHAFEVGNGSMMDFSFESGFWVFNLVSNFAYTRYNLIHPEIRAEQTRLEDEFIKEAKEIDKKAMSVYEEDKNAAIEMLTDYSGKAGNETVKHWLNFYTYLFTKYMDGNVKSKREVPDGYKYATPELNQPGYGDEWYKRIADDTGDKLKVQGSAGH